MRPSLLPPASSSPGTPGTTSSPLTRRPTGSIRCSSPGSRRTRPGTAGTYRSNIGLVNASQFSNTVLKVTLYAGNAPTTPVGTPYQAGLGPLGQIQCRSPRPSQPPPERITSSRSSRSAARRRRCPEQLSAERLPGLLRLRVGPRQRVGRRHDARAAVLNGA